MKFALISFVSLLTSVALAIPPNSKSYIIYWQGEKANMVLKAKAIIAKMDGEVVCQYSMYLGNISK